MRLSHHAGRLWDADKLTVKALVTRNGEKLAPVDLVYAGQTSQFKGSVPVFGAGVYDAPSMLIAPRPAIRASTAPRSSSPSSVPDSLPLKGGRRLALGEPGGGHAA
ncbi:hypothetical protein [Methyloceanibacter marginalis]|uniref:hypothetical protein n=1 Tax=Methyloceanibacter marginalis TaxID=1774971 RepID=UPI00195D1AA5|nr:hypothetical protein [Methyloceanibacter marginalis]